uniref:Uncharacterized protein n=1 Tax=Rhizophagus irregularis (strain DAOM 181602 / DAOM 197198 / MUCL 43194) TaxID=747089 RepID=U9SIE3_RHIID
MFSFKRHEGTADNNVLLIVIVDRTDYYFDEPWRKIMHQVFELIIRGKVSLLTEADPTAFNDPCDDKYRDTFKDRVKQKIILRSSTGILLPYGFKCSRALGTEKNGRYVVGIVVKVSSFDKSIEHKQIRGNSVSSSVNKLIEHRQTGSQEKLPPCHQSIN